MVDLITLAQAGPVAILLVGIAVLTRAFLTGAVVPGWVYRKVETRAEKAEADVVELIKAARDALKVVANGNGKPGASDGK